MSSPIPPVSVAPLEVSGLRKGLLSTFWYDFFRTLAGVNGVWTPAITFFTPGDLSVTYSPGNQVGWFTKQGRLVTLHFALVTATFTHTTAAGGLRITGVPYPPNTINGSGRFFRGNGMQWQGITKAGYTQMTPNADPAGFIVVTASGSGLSGSDVVAADMPTGGAVQLRSSITYETNE